MAEANPNARLETFCDGVFAIALTLLVIELRVPEAITSEDGLWEALKHMAPRMLAFLWSFTIIFITWVNHHGALKLAGRSTGAFIYANGFLLLCVAFLPFPTALMGEYLQHPETATPAVVLYVGVMVAQSIAWIVMGEVALKQRIPKDARAEKMVRGNTRNGYIGLVIYSICAVLAFWFPYPIAILTAAFWLVWLVVGISLGAGE